MPTAKEYLTKQTFTEATYQKKLTAGTNVTIDPVTNVISAAAEGSDVSVTQKTSTGVNIADITVDGITTRLYAPNQTVEGVSVYVGTTTPTSSLGSDGDLYYKYRVQH